MNPHIIVSIITLSLTVMTALVVFIENPKSKVNRSFGVLGLSIALWIASNILADLASNADAALLWSKIAIIWPVVMTTSFFYLVIRLYYREDLRRYNKFLNILIAIGLMIVLLSPTHWNIESVSIEEWGVDYVPGPLYYLLAIYLVMGFGSVLYLLSRTYRLLRESNQHYQAKYMLIGTTVALLLAFTANILLPLLGYGVSSIAGPPAILFFIGFTAYAILKHKLFNIKIIAAELLTFVIWFVLFFQTLLAESFEALVINGCLLFFVIIFGIFLIRGVIKEVEEGEKLEALSRKLEKANEQLEELDKMKSRFLSFASHQVKTPMTAIKGYACLIYYNTDRLSRSKIKQMAGKMKLSTDRTISLVNNLLDLRKIEEGRMQYTFEPVILAQTVREIIEELRLVAQEKGLYLVFETPAYEGTVEVDAQKMREVLQNLVENSIKYTDRGWVRVTLKEDTEGNVIFLVKDSGRGIAPAVVPHLFREYERGSAVTSAIQGTGLGLFIAKQIISDHSGKIWAESAGEGKGSSFFAKLPIRRTHA